MRASGGLTIRRETRAADDGHRSSLAPGLRSTPDAHRLAEAIEHAAGRLTALACDPPGLYADVAVEPDAEEATWLAFLIAYLGLLEGGPDPFATVRAARTTWSSGDLPRADNLPLGERAAYDGARAEQTLLAYRRWAERAGSQSAGFTADPSWTPAQRFERVFERLALPGLHRRARYELLVTLGALGRYPLAAPSLLLGEDDEVSRAAKRVFGIGDRLTLERRARELASAVGVPIETLDLALENWSRDDLLTLGVSTADEDVLGRALAALEC